MKMGLLILLCISPCFSGKQSAIGQTEGPNTDPRRVREIVQAESQKAATKAVEFGMWVHDREVITMALGNSMTTQKATTAMHYRIGGIAKTFMSTLLLMLVDQRRIRSDDNISPWLRNLLAVDQVPVRMPVRNRPCSINHV